MTGSRSTRSERLLRVLSDYKRIVLVTHDNPDPDGIAAGWALQVLIRARLHKTARLIAGGAIVRAENRHLVKLLDPPIELVQELRVQEMTAAVLIDCSATTENHLLARECIRPVAVIDHHVIASRADAALPFRDIRPSVAAAASIAGSYLREQEIEPSVRLATTLSYAIRTETRGCQVHHSRLDRSVVRWLAQYVDPEWIAEIESAPLARGYFGDLTRALESTFLYGETAFCLLPRANGAEIVGEVADLLVRYDAVHSVFCAALIGEDVVVSVRTIRGGQDATALVQATLSGLGGSGGHTQRAGGRISAASLTGKVGRALEDDLRRRWLAACGVDQVRGQRLVPVRDSATDECC